MFTDIRQANTGTGGPTPVIHHRDVRFEAIGEQIQRTGTYKSGPHLHPGVEHLPAR
jgi:hypothetical protein